MDDSLIDLRSLQVTFRGAMFEVLSLLRNAKAIVSFSPKSKEQQELFSQLDTLTASFEIFVIRLDAWIRSLAPAIDDDHNISGTNL